MGSLPDSKYIIKTDGYWFVEAHDVEPSKGYISVSAEGIVNGLSNQPNDGADFGPDSYNPNYSGSGIPYTQTSGIQEAVNYAKNNNAIPIRLSSGNFNITSQITIDDNGIQIYGSGGLAVTGLVTDYDTEPINGTVINISNASDGIHIEPSGKILSGIVLRDFIVNYTNTLGGTGNAFYISGATSGYYSLMHFDMVNLSALNVDSSHYPFYIANFLYARIENLYAKGEGTIFRFNENNSSINFGNSVIVNLFGNQVNKTYTGNLIEFVCDTHDNGLNLIYVNRLQVNFLTNVPSNLLYTKGMSLSSITGLDIENGKNPTANAYNITLEAFTNVQDLYVDISTYIPSGYTLDFTITNVSRSVLNLIAEALNYNLTLTGVSNVISYATGTLKSVSGQGIIFRDVNALGYNVTPSLTTNPPATATVYQNTNPYDIRIYLPAYASTSGTAGTVAIALGSSSSPSTIGTRYISGSTSSSSTDILELVVPAGWYYEYTLTGVTLATATVVAA